MSVESTFFCRVCSKEAGRIRLLVDPPAVRIRCESFTGVLSEDVPPEQVAPLRAAIELNDARALYELELEYTPFLCPKCDAIYCGDHWVAWDVFADDAPGWHDSIQGRCPEGHQRMLED